MASPRRDSPSGPSAGAPGSAARKSRDETLMDKIGTLARKKKVKEGNLTFCHDNFLFCVDIQDSLPMHCFGRVQVFTRH